jgi:mono/diheme cytochrome c family protein
MGRLTIALYWLIAGLLGLILVIQFVPFGRAHTNPPVGTEPTWNNPRTRELTVRACFDCHSNETAWPWYSNVAPISWLIQRDVDKGRKKLNFSEWDRPQEEAHESAKTLRKGEMPPWYYPWGRLTSAERQALIQGLESTLGTKEPNGNRERRHRKEEYD